MFFFSFFFFYCRCDSCINRSSGKRGCKNRDTHRTSRTKGRDGTHCDGFEWHCTEDVSLLDSSGKHLFIKDSYMGPIAVAYLNKYANDYISIQRLLFTSTRFLNNPEDTIRSMWIKPPVSNLKLTCKNYLKLPTYYTYLSHRYVLAFKG